MTQAIHIVATDDLKNKAIVSISDGQVRCKLANGIPASLSYAGIRHDVIAEAEIRLASCASTDDALSVMNDFSFSRWHHAALN